MAYENLQLVIAGLSGEIYLSKINKGGVMSDSRRVATEDVQRAATEWFMSNKKKMISYGIGKDGKKPTLFFTDDKEKADRILAILQE